MTNKFDEIFEKAGYKKLKVSSTKKVKETFKVVKEKYKDLLERLKD